MKEMKHWLPMVLAVALIALLTNGCVKKKPAAMGGFEGGDQIEVFGSDGDFYGEDLPSMRPGEAGMTIAEGQSQFEPVYFEYDSSQISPSERLKIETVADYMRQNSDVGIIIEGHCDERGSREYNLALGERRALAVRAYLIGLGIDGNRIQTKSYGEENPADFGHDASAWSLNRRGEFILFY
jgi:peptidoglycan-associated lipoprotein